jgi:hypothetical protein
MGTETWQRTVELDGAEVVQAEVRISSGELKMAGGAASLLEGAFSFAPDWQPIVTYDVQDGLGRLIVEPPQERGMMNSRPQYVWDLRLGGAVPVDLDVKLGSGQGTLGLTKARLSKLAAHIGSGQMIADLSGCHPELTFVDLAGASGRLGLVLNGDYPALKAVTLKNASGITHVTLGGQYADLEQIRLSAASGDINLGLSGDLPQLARVHAKLASGAVDLNFQEASWTTLDAVIDCVSGRAIVRYPADVGVRVRFSSVTGRLDAPGLVKDAGGYRTANYADAERTLSLSMSTVSGKLMLQPADN